jgi:hypothetical protein
MIMICKDKQTTNNKNVIILREIYFFSFLETTLLLFIE